MTSVNFQDRHIEWLRNNLRQQKQSQQYAGSKPGQSGQQNDQQMCEEILQQIEKVGQQSQNKQ